MVAAILAAGIAGCEGGDGEAAAPTVQLAAATAFLQAYVASDGRVSRPDQGNDTVSEGQAYALLLAEVTGDDEVFDRVWRWTREHLQRSDGLLAYHADADGKVLDQQPASDADVLIAWALLRYDGPDAEARHAEGRRVAAAVLAHEVTAGPAGEPLLAAGPWATGRPATLNPSYWALATFRDMAALTDDDRWRRMADAVVPLTERFTEGGRLLPADWVELTADGTLRPVPAPGGSAQPAQPVQQAQYGLDAQRLVVWLATACDDRAEALAAGWWAKLRQANRAKSLALRLDGAVSDGTAAVLPLVAAASAAMAAGDRASSEQLLARADEQQRHHPTYYGGAWAALGRTLLTTEALGSCPAEGA